MLKSIKCIRFTSTVKPDLGSWNHKKMPPLLIQKGGSPNRLLIQWVSKDVETSEPHGTKIESVICNSHQKQPPVGRRPELNLTCSELNLTCPVLFKVASNTWNALKALNAFALPRPRNRIKAAYITRCQQISTNPTKRSEYEVAVDEKKPKVFPKNTLCDCLLGV
jgi:hypothetical protein